VSVLSPPPSARTIDDLLADARSRLARVTPREAAHRVALGAVLVDIRPAAQRAAEGEVPGALVVERNVLEWRFDPACDDRLEVASYELELVLFCNEGYASSLAAATLQSLGLRHATDMTGGFRAWRALGLPVVSPYGAHTH